MTKPHTPEIEFITLVALLTALVAMSIDTMLPAIGSMAHELGAAHENDRQLIILLFFAGLSLGTLIFGPVSDSTGRKPAIYAGLGFYLIGCLMCYFAGSFPMLIAGRFVQGFGAAAPRVVSMAMVRDGAKGADMARIMSYVMSVFMLVPIIAPSIGQIVLTFGNWRIIFLGFMAMACLAGLWLALRQGETLAAENRHPFEAGSLWESAVAVVRHPVSFGYTIAVGFVFAAFNVYLATCQQVFAEQYRQGSYFALWFGGFAVGLAISMIVNGRTVRRIGMRTLSKYALLVFLVNWAIMLVAALVTGGQPPLLLVAVLNFVSFFANGMTFGNYNAMAMEPMGRIAGMAAAVSGALSSLMAVILGGLAARYYDGTMTPIALAFVVFGALAWLASEWAEAGRRRLVTKTTL
ncbi:MAG: multidrug effflux MFS transporter [Hyphomicrobiales bacterium]